MAKPFSMILPKPIQNGHKILVKGKLNNDAKEFSFNFVKEIDPFPSNIFYHFKAIISENLVIENIKKSGEWMSENIVERVILCSKDSELALEFIFKDEGVYVYAVIADGRNFISYYQLEDKSDEITSVQICGDIEEITEIRFQYP